MQHPSRDLDVVVLTVGLCNFIEVQMEVPQFLTEIVNEHGLLYRTAEEYCRELATT